MYVCLFDIDGTLLNTGGAGQAAMEAALAGEFAAGQPVDGIPTAGRTDRAIARDLFRHFGISHDEEALERFLCAYLRELPAHLASHDGSVLPGVPALLDELSARDDVLLGLLTGNFRQGAQLKLEYYGLLHHFRFGGYGDRHFDRNDVAREAMAELRRHYDGEVHLDRVWVIGDTPADVACARAIGARVVAVATGVYSAAELDASAPDHLLPDFSDPSPLLDALS